MSPDDISRILSELRAIASKTAENTTATKVLTAEFKAHREAEEKASDVRAATCPQLPDIVHLGTDLDAIAGIARANQKDIAELKTWRESITLDSAVDDAEKHIMFAPIKWARANAEKILLAILIAWLIARFGL